MIAEGGQRLAEAKLIGNREVSDRDCRVLQGELEMELDRNTTWMPEALRNVLRDTIQVAREPESGFRKRRTPALLFKYFRDMSKVLGEIRSVVRPGGMVALVIGDNSVAGPEYTTITIGTGQILTELAELAGLEPMQVYAKRLTSYGAPDTIHQRNAMSDEAVFLWKRS